MLDARHADGGLMATATPPADGTGGGGRHRRARGRQGPEDRRHRLRLERRHRRRLDGARLQPGRLARPRGRRRRASACTRRRSCSSRSCRCSSSRRPTTTSTGPTPTAARRSPGSRARWDRGRAGWAAGRSSSPTSSSWPTSRRSPACTRSCSSAGSRAADSTVAVTLVGVAWIAIMTWICVIGIELSARTQVFLLGAEIITLTLFAVVALVKVARGHRGPDAVDPSLSWLNPLADRQHQRVRQRGAPRRVHLLGLGLDGDRQRGEPRQPRGPGQGGRRRHAASSWRSTSSSSIAAQAYDGPQPLIDNSDDVLSVAGQGRLRLAAGQAPDHRRADLGGGVDADDDPADGAHVAVDGARGARCPRSSGACTRAT